jgi:hypothetical protein
VRCSAPNAILDPFAVYAEGDTVLRGQLNALDEGKLRNIVKAYGLSRHSAAEIDRMPKAELSRTIIQGVEQRQPQR